MANRNAGRLGFVVLLVVFIMFGIAGCGAPPEQNRQAEVEPVAVSVVTAEKGDLQKITNLSGEIAAQESINIIPKMGGKVEDVLVDVGDKVKKGQVLVRLETKEIRAQLKQARAGLEAAKAAAEQAQARFAEAKKNLARMEELYQQGAISQQTLDQVRMQYELAKTAAAEAQKEQAEAGVQLAETQLENAIIKSPIAGIVAFRYVDPGDMAGPSSPVITVVNMDTVTVTVNVSESEINSVQLGDKVEVTVPAAGDRTVFQGEVTMVSPAADPRTKAYPVEVTIDNPEHIIKPGMFAQVALGTVSVKDVVVIPQEAVIDAGGKKVVYVAGDGKAIEKDVKVGITTGEQAAILEGLSVGEKVIVKGQHRLEHGTPIAVQESSSTVVQGGDR